MNIFTEIQESMAEILDIDTDTPITRDTNLIRELGAESIDLLELAVTLSNRMNTDIVDDDIFLRRLREYIIEAEQNGTDTGEHLEKKYPFLPPGRINEILEELDQGPVLEVGDLESYVRWRMRDETGSI